MAGRALIIGGTGQVGYATARALCAAGWEVTAAHRGRHQAPPDLGVETVVLDRSDDDALAEAAHNRDLVVDTVAFTADHARQLLRLDVGALAVISTASVYRGSNGTYLDIATDDESFPDFPVPITEDWPTVDSDEHTYSPDKAAMERVLLSGDVPVSLLRAGCIHGPYSPGLREWFFIKRALDHRPHVVLANGGQGRFHPAATVNIAALVVACAQRGGTHVLNAVDDECPTEAEIGRLIFDAMGHDGEIITVPGPPRGNVGSSPWGVAKQVVLSMQRARDEVGYVAPASYAEAIHLDIDWAVQTVEAAQARGQTWREAFESVTSWGADTWFDYDDEDRLVAELPDPAS